MSREFISPELRKRVIARDCGICRYCGQYADNPHLDHVYPASKGGETTIENLVTSCQFCNLKKHAKVGIWPLPLREIDEIKKLSNENKRLADKNKEASKIIGNVKQNEFDNYNLKMASYNYLLIAACIPALLGFVYIFVVKSSDLVAACLLLTSMALFILSYIYRGIYFSKRGKK